MVKNLQSPGFADCKFWLQSPSFGLKTFRPCASTSLPVRFRNLKVISCGHRLVLVKLKSREAELSGDSASEESSPNFSFFVSNVSAGAATTGVSAAARLLSASGSGVIDSTAAELLSTERSATAQLTWA